MSRYNNPSSRKLKVFLHHWTIELVDLRASLLCICKFALKNYHFKWKFRNNICLAVAETVGIEEPKPLTEENTCGEGPVGLQCLAEVPFIRLAKFLRPSRASLRNTRRFLTKPRFLQSADKAVPHLRIVARITREHQPSNQSMKKWIANPAIIIPPA